MDYHHTERIDPTLPDDWPKYCPKCGNPLSRDIVRYDVMTGVGVYGMTCRRKGHWDWSPGEDPYANAGVRSGR